MPEDGSDAHRAVNLARMAQGLSQIAEPPQVNVWPKGDSLESTPYPYPTITWKRAEAIGPFPCVFMVWCRPIQGAEGPGKRLRHHRYLGTFPANPNEPLDILPPLSTSGYIPPGYGASLLVSVAELGQAPFFGGAVLCAKS